GHEGQQDRGRRGGRGGGGCLGGGGSGRLQRVVRENRGGVFLRDGVRLHQTQEMQSRLDREREHARVGRVRGPHAPALDQRLEGGAHRVVRLHDRLRRRGGRRQVPEDAARER